MPTRGVEFPRTIAQAAVNFANPGGDSHGNALNHFSWSENLENFSEILLTAFCRMLNIWVKSRFVRRFRPAWQAAVVAQLFDCHVRFQPLFRSVDPSGSLGCHASLCGILGVFWAVLRPGRFSFVRRLRRLCLGRRPTSRGPHKGHEPERSIDVRSMERCFSHLWRFERRPQFEYRFGARAAPLSWPELPQPTIGASGAGPHR